MSHSEALSFPAGRKNRATVSKTVSTFGTRVVIARTGTYFHELGNCSLTGPFEGVYPLEQRGTMDRFRMYARADRGGTFYWEDTENRRQGSLKTKDRGTAAKLLQAKNETVRQPNLNRELGRVYMKAADPSLTTRTWQQVIDVYCNRAHLRESSRERPQRAFAGRHFDPIRQLVLTETTTEQLLSVIEKVRNASTQHYLRRLHNYAVGLCWLP